MKQGTGKTTMDMGRKNNVNAVSLDAVSQMGAHTKEGPPPLFKKSNNAQAPGCIACDTHKSGSQGRH